MPEDVLAFERIWDDSVCQRCTERYALSQPLPERVQRSTQSHKLLLFSVCNHWNVNCIWTEIQWVQKGKKNTISFPVTPLDIDPSLLNTSAFTGVSQSDLGVELADRADKEFCVSNFTNLITDLEDVARQKTNLSREHKWSDIENLPKPDKLWNIFLKWNVKFLWNNFDT